MKYEVREIEYQDKWAFLGLFDRFCQEAGEEADLERVWELLPLGIPSYKLWVVTADETVVGFMDFLPYESGVKPFHCLTVQYLYIDPTHLGQLWRVLSVGLKLCKKLGVERITISSPLYREAFWEKHGYSKKYVQMERGVMKCHQQQY